MLQFIMVAEKACLSHWHLTFGWWYLYSFRLKPWIGFDRTVNIAHNWIEYGEEADGVFKTKEEIPAAYINGTYTTQYFYSIELSKFIREMAEDGKLEVGDKFKSLLKVFATQTMRA